MVRISEDGAGRRSRKRPPRLHTCYWGSGKGAESPQGYTMGPLSTSSYPRNPEHQPRGWSPYHF